MIVLIPSPLHSYTQGCARMECEATSLRELLDWLDMRFPGIRFRMIDEQERIRTHIRIFADGAPLESLEAPLASTTELMIVAALSGG